MVRKERSFSIQRCTLAQLPEILHIQEETIRALSNPALLRRNTPQMLESCLLAPHITLGAFDGDAIAGFSVLYFPTDPTEDLAGLLTTVDISGKKAANYKLCIVRQDYRGYGLQRLLEQALEECAVAEGVQLLCATVSPENEHSMRNVLRCGYTYDRTLQKYGLPRNLYYKFL